ncbi:MAG: cysteine--tRNA ligase [Puniceicoccales bacterium]|nr:cysteine--tRNA ligase [Puniceicoccales bacterium]
MTSVSLHNTSTKTKDTLTPSSDGIFRVYCCGPTVYAAAHIGNFRTFLLQDVLRRVLEMSGYHVRWVRNLTDIDDKTIRGAQQQQIPLKEFTQHWIDVFHEDCQKLQIRTPEVEPRATEHIDDQIRWIEKLIRHGFAYAVADGSVYYRIASFPRYGQLSCLASHNLLPAQAKNITGDADEYDRDNIHDFALWKSRKAEDGECYWNSPWGQGRPGWHIECSVMAMRYLGETLDLHGGGIDLCFPHHENEIAQSEAITQKCFSKHWFHSAHLMVDGQKMSKSLGNLYTLQELQDQDYSPMAIRYALIAGHYRQPLNFTLQSLSTATSALQKLAKVQKQLQVIATTEAIPPMTHDNISEKTSASPLTNAWKALREDLNIPQCLGIIFTETSPSALRTLSPTEAYRLLHDFKGIVLGVLGLTLPEVDTDRRNATIIPEQIQELAEQRLTAKRQKLFDKADQLREQIHSMGWRIIDHPDGFTLEKDHS